MTTESKALRKQALSSVNKIQIFFSLVFVDFEL